MSNPGCGEKPVKTITVHLAAKVLIQTGEKLFAIDIHQLRA